MLFPPKKFGLELYIMTNFKCLELKSMPVKVQHSNGLHTAKLYKQLSKTRKMFLLTKTKRPKKVHCNIIYSRKRFLKIKTCSAERRSES